MFGCREPLTHTADSASTLQYAGRSLLLQVSQCTGQQSERCGPPLQRPIVFVGASVISDCRASPTTPSRIRVSTSDPGPVYASVASRSAPLTDLAICLVRFTGTCKLCQDHVRDSTPLLKASSRSQRFGTGKDFIFSMYMRK